MSFSVSINNKVRQSNNLVESPYAQEFTAHEIKIFEIAVASCSINDYDLVTNQRDKSFSISNNELAKLLNTKPSVISMEIEKTASRIIKKTMHLRKVLSDGNVEFEMINIIPFAKYKDGIFQFRLNYSIIPYLLEINKNFTEFQLHFLLSLSSAYSIKLYKLLYQYKNIKIRVFTIDELREQFGIIDKYPQYKNFKQKIIEPSILQINKLTDLAVSYNELKFGRKVDKLEFIFEVKKPALPNIRQTDIGVDITDIKPSLSNIDNLLLSIDTELSNTTRELVAKYSKEKGVDYVDASIDYAKKNAKTNLDKYLNDTLVNGWAEVKIKKITETKSKAHAKINALRQDSLKKEQEKEAENLSKSIVEHEWSKLLDNNKANFTSYANFIITKYSKNLSSFKTIHQTLPLCIYAISNGKSYDRMLESYAKNALNLSLNINDMIVS